MRRTALVAAALVAVSSVGMAQKTFFAAPRATHTLVMPALDDATIVAIFDGANTADIETGTLAKTRGQSKEVREFGAMLLRDHTMVRQQGRDLAAKLGVTPTAPADDAGARDHAAAMKSLRAVPKGEFDQAFLHHEVAFHAAVIGAVTTTLLPAIKNAELKKLVTTVAPAFEAHRAAAAQLSEQLAKKGGK